MERPYPFRLGSTSYVYPADVLPNVRRLAPVVEDVELVLFEVDEWSNLPDAATLAELQRLAGAHGLTYTVHLPLDLRLADAGAGDGPSLSMAKALKVIRATRELRPWAYVAHLDGKPELAQGPAADWERWRWSCARVLRQLSAEAGGAPICIENLEHYDPATVMPVLDLAPVGLCLDVGHLWLEGRDAVAFFRRYQAHVRVVHLHGIGSRDHQSLRFQPAAEVNAFLDELRRARYDGVVTLEVFSVEDFNSSRAMVHEWAGAPAEPLPQDGAA